MNPASTCGLNETITLLRVEPLHRAARHRRILQVSDQGLIAPRRREANHRRIKAAGYATLFYQSLNYLVEQGGRCVRTASKSIPICFRQ